MHSITPTLHSITPTIKPLQPCNKGSSSSSSDAPSSPPPTRPTRPTRPTLVHWPTIEQSRFSLFSSNPKFFIGSPVLFSLVLLSIFVFHFYTLAENHSASSSLLAEVGDLRQAARRLENNATQLAWCAATDRDNSFAADVCETVTGNDTPSSPIIDSELHYLADTDEVRSKMAALSASRPGLVSELVTALDDVTSQYADIVGVALLLLASSSAAAAGGEDPETLLLLRATIKECLDLLSSGIEVFVAASSEINVTISESESQVERFSEATAAFACLAVTWLYGVVFVYIVRAAKERFLLAEKVERDRVAKLRVTDSCSIAKTEAVEMTLAQICHEVSVPLECFPCFPAFPSTLLHFFLVIYTNELSLFPLLAPSLISIRFSFSLSLLLSPSFSLSPSLSLLLSPSFSLPSSLSLLFSPSFSLSLYLSVSLSFPLLFSLSFFLSFFPLPPSYPIVQVRSHQAVVHIALESTKDFLRNEAMKMAPKSKRGLVLKDQILAVDAAIEASEEQANVLANRLDMGRLMKGQYVLKSEPIEANFLCKSLLNSNKVAINPDVELIVEDEKGEVDSTTWIGVDTFLLTRALVNLFSNARKNTYEGSVRVKIGLKDVRNAGEENSTANLVVTVTDTGVGIQEDRWPGIFDDGDKKFRDLRGTGLGLPFVNVIVATMGGTVRLVSSVISVGTVFELVVPVKNLRDRRETSSCEVDELASLPRNFFSLDKRRSYKTIRVDTLGREDIVTDSDFVLTDSAPRLLAGRKISVLVVDDQPTLRKMIKHRLEALGEDENIEWSVDDCRIGEEAIKKVERGNKYDVITMDQNMEREGGVLKGHQAMIKIRQLGFEGLMVSLSGDDSEEGSTGDWSAFMKGNGADIVWGKPLPKKKAMWKELSSALLLTIL